MMVRALIPINCHIYSVKWINTGNHSPSLHFEHQYLGTPTRGGRFFQYIELLAKCFSYPAGLRGCPLGYLFFIVSY